MADKIYGGTLSSIGNESWINLENGHFSLGNGKIRFEGKELIIDLEASNIDTEGIKEELRGEFTAGLEGIRGELEEKTTYVDENGNETSIVDKLSESIQEIDNITNRIATTESEIVNINGELVTVDTRVKQAEAKLTDEAFSLKVEEIVGDEYVKGTQLKQEIDNITASVISTDGYNKIKNSRAEINNNYVGNMGRYSASNSTKITNRTYFRLDNKTTTKNFSRTACFIIKPNQIHTYKFMYMINSYCTGFRAYINYFNDTANVDSLPNGNDSSIVAYTHDSTKTKNSVWNEVVITFTTPAEARSCYLTFKNDGTTDTDHTSCVYLTDMLLYEGATIKSDGTIVCKPWSPHPSECYTVNAILDGQGLTINNGAITVKNSDNETIFTASNKKFMTMRGNITQYDADTGKKSISLENNGVNIYDHPSSGNSSLVGKFEFYETTNRTNSTRRRGVRLYSSYSDIISLGHLNSSGSFVETIVLDGTKKYSGNQTNLSIYGVVGVYDVLTFRSADRSYGGDILSDDSKLRIRANFDDGGFIVFGQSDSLTDNVAELKRASFYHKGNISCGGNMSCVNMTCTGTLSATGGKNRLVQVGKAYVGVNAYETAECYFGDIGEGVIGENGETTIIIEELFSKTVDLSVPYQVFLSKYGEGECWVERLEDRFIVHGTPNLSFCYEIKAKQKDYTDVRLKVSDAVTLL